MLAKKISFQGAILFVAVAFAVAGCTPAGPRALLKGKKALDHGDYAAAVAQLKTATTLLETNASAWNYYGVALQLAGHPDEAMAAYQTSLKWDRDLVETHFNLGSLALEQGKPDIAKSEFSAYTLRRQNDALGWLKLGTAQLKLGEVATAERSFSTVLSLKQNEAEAYNGLGLARIQRSLPRDAVKFFAAAIAARADYAPAVLNLATVNQQYLHDNKAALENYKKYAALAPRSANLAEVSSLIAALEPAEIKVAVATPLPPPEKTPTVANPSEVKPTPKIIIGTTQRVAVATKPAPVKPNPIALPSVKPLPVQVVQVKPEPLIVTTPVVVSNVPVSPAVTAKPVAAEPLEAPMPEEPPKKSFWGKVFNSPSRSQSVAETKYRGNALTPLPAADAPPSAKPVIVQPAKPLVVVEPVPVFARYTYFNPRKPAPGDRTAANGAFTKARLLEQDEKWPDALQWYQESAALDPSWFEAQYNTGVLAHRLRNYALALPRYEMALAAQPDSADARYNFALALKAAGYVPDAAEQLKIMLAANQREVRAHLALANLCAQSLRDNSQARGHYQKVLELEPNNAQASDIRSWLFANPN
jgi:tetratricopeptide (TPR) repeat protein